jgi:hypothetical protein
MRVRIRRGESSTALDEALPLAGRILHPESNRAEWAIVGLDMPVDVAGVPTDLLWLRPATAKRAVGDPGDISVHVAVVVSVREVEGQPVYGPGKLLGQVVCGPEAAG